MDNFTLNNAIAELVYPDAHLIRTSRHGAAIYLSPTSAPIRVDYCNNWNDLMPLVVDNGIGINTSNIGNRDSWCAEKHWHKDKWHDVTIHNKNPQRALAECLLLVLQDKENNND